MGAFRAQKVDVHEQPVEKILDTTGMSIAKISCAADAVNKGLGDDPQAATRRRDRHFETRSRDADGILDRLVHQLTASSWMRKQET
jgi:hypothetical protein